MPGPSARRTTAPTLGECGHVVGQLGSPGRSRADAAGTGSHGARARFPYRTDDGIAVRPAECAGRPSSSTRRRAAHHSPGPPGSLPRTLDEPIPSLGNQSPRKEANHSAQGGRVYPVGSYGFTWIWKELGLRDERRSSDLHRAFGSAPVCGGIQRRARARALRRSEVRIPSRLRRASSLSPLRLAPSTASCSERPLSSATPAIRPSLMQKPHMETRFQKLDRQGCGEPGHP